MINVVVVEDSMTVRKLLVALLDEDSQIRVVGEAKDGREAVEMAARLNPDLITMDVEMPDMDGLEATRRIMKTHPTAILIVTAHADSPELNVAFEAMRAGALDVVAKPQTFGEASDQWESELVTKTKELAKIKPAVKAEERKP